MLAGAALLPNTRLTVEPASTTVTELIATTLRTIAAVWLLVDEHARTRRALLQRQVALQPADVVRPAEVAVIGTTPVGLTCLAHHDLHDRVLARPVHAQVIGDGVTIEWAVAVLDARGLRFGVPGTGGVATTTLFRGPRADTDFARDLRTVSIREAVPGPTNRGLTVEAAGAHHMHAFLGHRTGVLALPVETGLPLEAVHIGDAQGILGHGRAVAAATRRAHE